MTKRYDYKTQQWVEDGVAEPVEHHASWPERYPNPTEPMYNPPKPIEDLPKWPGGPAMEEKPYEVLPTTIGPSASNEPKVVTVTEENKEVNIEDPNMLDRIFKALASKVVEASDLAKRVAELERICNDLEARLQGVASDLRTEREAHNDTKNALNDVRNRLDHEQRAVHDLVVERDMERDAKQQVQTTLQVLQSDCAFWTSEAQRLEKERNEAIHASDVCREQREQMAKQVEALRSAFGALRVIG